MISILFCYVLCCVRYYLNLDFHFGKKNYLIYQKIWYVWSCIMEASCIASRFFYHWGLILHIIYFSAEAQQGSSMPWGSVGFCHVDCIFSQWCCLGLLSQLHPMSATPQLHYSSMGREWGPLNSIWDLIDWEFGSCHFLISDVNSAVLGVGSVTARGFSSIIEQQTWWEKSVIFLFPSS